MLIRNIRGFIYLDNQLIASPGADFMFARTAGPLGNVVEICIDEDAHAGTGHIPLYSGRYTAISLDGTTYDSAADAVTGLNAVFQDGSLALPETTLAGDLPTSNPNTAGEMWVSSGTVKVSAG